MLSVAERLVPTPARMREVLGCRFRSNPTYRLVPHSDLPPEDRSTLSGLTEDPQHFGVLVPGRAELGVMAIDQATARLFTELENPGRLPGRVRDNSDAGTNGHVVRLVLDGILEIERDGRFLSGPQAHEAILAGPSAYGDPPDPIVGLSREALRCAQTLPIGEPKHLAQWLYKFNALPLSPRWITRLGTPDAVAQVTGRAVGDPVRRRLEKEYDHAPVRGWHSWQARDRTLRYQEPTGTAPAYKLYISPHPSALAEVFRSIVNAFVELRPPAFKTGSDVLGVLRPDKLMIYFDDLPELERFARRVKADLDGCVPHGVPFTAAFDKTGLLSWGVDPPRATRIPGWSGSESWRMWLTARLARALLTSRNVEVEDLEPWVCALDRISVEGIDPDSWTPVQELWGGGGVA